MGKNDDRKHVHDLAVFALKVLKVLEEGAPGQEAVRTIAKLAHEWRFAISDSPGYYFQRTPRGRHFKDTWYGSSSDHEEAPRVGDHVERDFT